MTSLLQIRNFKSPWLHLKGGGSSLFDPAFRSLDLAHEKAPKPLRTYESEIKVPHSTIWLPHDRPILDASADLIGLLSSYGPDAIAEKTRRLDSAWLVETKSRRSIRIGETKLILGPARLRRHAG